MTTKETLKQSLLEKTAIKSGKREGSAGKWLGNALDFVAGLILTLKFDELLIFWN